MKYFINRLKEPSTWAGLSALAVLFGVPPEAATVLVQAIGGLAGAYAVFAPNTK